MRASLLAVAKFIYNYYVFTVVYSIIRPSDDSEALKIVEIKKLSPHRESIRSLINVAGRFSVFCFCFCFCFFHFCWIFSLLLPLHVLLQKRMVSLLSSK